MPVVVDDVQHAHDVTVVAAGWYRTALRDVVVDWKERGRFPLTSVLSHHLALSVAALVGERGRVDLVPVPPRGRRGGAAATTSCGPSRAPRLSGSRPPAASRPCVPC